VKLPEAFGAKLEAYVGRPVVFGVRPEDMAARAAAAAKARAGSRRVPKWWKRWGRNLRLSQLRAAFHRRPDGDAGTASRWADLEVELKMPGRTCSTRRHRKPSFEIGIRRITAKRREPNHEKNRMRRDDDPAVRRNARNQRLGPGQLEAVQGTEIRFLMNKHPFTTFIEPKVPEFEKLTGIKVVMEVFPEDQYRNKRTIELNAGGKLDGYMIMPGQDELYYWKAGWLQPLDDYIKNPS